MVSVRVWLPAMPAHAGDDRHQHRQGDDLVQRLLEATDDPGGEKDGDEIDSEPHGAPLGAGQTPGRTGPLPPPGRRSLSIARSASSRMTSTTSSMVMRPSRRSSSSSTATEIRSRRSNRTATSCSVALACTVSASGCMTDSTGSSGVAGMTVGHVQLAGDSGRPARTPSGHRCGAARSCGDAASAARPPG